MRDNELALINSASRPQPGTRLLGKGLILGSWHGVLSHLTRLSQGCFCCCHLLVRALAHCRVTLHMGGTAVRLRQVRE